MLTCNKGFSVIELLIALTIIGMIMAGLYDLVVTTSRFYVAQNNVVQMQADGRTTMDFIVRELRSAFGPTTITTTTSTDDTINFNRVEDTGQSSGGNTGTTLNDNTKNWIVNEYSSSTTSEFSIRIISGTGSGQVRTIKENSSTRITPLLAWGVVPNETSIYLITSNKTFTRTFTSDNVLRYRIGTTGNNNPLAENIVSHSFKNLTPPNTNTIRVTLKSRTNSLDPTTKQYKYYELTEDVRRRN